MFMNFQVEKEKANLANYQDQLQKPKEKFRSKISN